MILGLVATLIHDRARLAEEDRAMARYIVGTSWEVSELLFEAQRYETALSDILAGQITVADLQLRHDILWSRLDIIRERARSGDKVLVELMEATRSMMEANDAILFSEPDLTFVDLARIRNDIRHQILEVRRYWVENVVANQNRYSLLGHNAEAKDARAHQLALDMIIIVAILALVLFALTEFIQSSREAARERRLHDAARAASAAKSRFLANVSHEVRTPLNGILGMAQALRDTPLTLDQRELVDTVSSSGENLLQILNSVLDLSKVEANRMELEVRPVDLGALLDRLALAHGAAARSKGVAFETWFAPDAHHTFMLDEMRVQQMLNNLLSNAIKFTAEGTVTLEVSVDGDGSEKILRFRISDTGIGMSPEVASHVFEPFAQADSSTTRAFGGTGLGLSLVREFSNLAGGKVEVDSTPGLGSTFTLSLPTRTAAVCKVGGPLGGACNGTGDPSDVPGGLDAPLSSIDGIRGLRALVVDDSKINRRVLSRFLSLAEARIVEACNGLEGLESALVGRFEVILVDVQMPEMDGTEMTRQIRTAEMKANLPRVPIIGVTANVLPEQVAAYREAGMDQVLAKPVRRAELFEALKRLVVVEDAA